MASNNNKHLFHKIRDIISNGLLVGYVKVYTDLAEADAWSAEIAEENRIRALGIGLCNIGKCGKGGDTLSNHPNKVEIYQRAALNRPKTRSESWRRNIRLGGLGRKVSDETREKIQERVSGSGNGMFGKKHSNETKRRMAEYSRNRVVSPETREKLGNIHRGKILTDETKLKISRAKTGSHHSEETRMRMRLSHLGTTLSPETRAKVSRALTGRTFSATHRERLSKWGSTRLGSTNPNFRDCSIESKNFIAANLDKSIYWLRCHAPEKMSDGQMKRVVLELTK